MVLITPLSFPSAEDTIGHRGTGECRLNRKKENDEYEMAVFLIYDYCCTVMNICHTYLYISMRLTVT